MRDEFLLPGKSYDRLEAEFVKYGKLVIGFDFDGTVFDFHKKGQTYNQVIELLRDLNKMGCKLVCWTSSNDLNFVKKYLIENNIPCDGVNVDGIDLGYYTVKPFFSALLDDRAGLLQVYDDLRKLADLKLKP